MMPKKMPDAGVLHVGAPNLYDEDAFIERVRKIFKSGRLTNRGPMVREFEQVLTDYLGVKHCICMCNGTIALEIAIRALGLTGEVIIPSFTFVATAHALQWQGIKPVFCDIDPETHNIDPIEVENHITDKTTGILGVHIWGRPCNINALKTIADEHGLTLMFDAAHAFGCSHDGRRIGGFGACEVFSFHATKVFNTFEGGAVTTNDDNLANKIRLMQNFGFQGMDNVVYIGTNGKMTEICAAMGLTGLECLAEIISVNKDAYELYVSDLQGIPGLSLMKYSTSEHSNYQYIVVEIDENIAGATRDHVIDRLHANNILARRYFYPGCHRAEPYRTLYPDSRKRLAKTEMICDRIICLPTGTAVRNDAIAALSDTLRAIVAQGSIV